MVVGVEVIGRVRLVVDEEEVVVIPDGRGEDRGVVETLRRGWSSKPSPSESSSSESDSSSSFSVSSAGLVSPPPPPPPLPASSSADGVNLPDEMRCSSSR